jgi:hypothetical protein
MSRKSLALDQLPHWPRMLSLTLAAAYVGVSPDMFLYEVRCGKWPDAERRGPNQGLRTWDRRLLDLALDRAAGLEDPDQARAPHPVIPPGEITRRIQLHAQTTQGRTKARSP